MEDDGLFSSEEYQTKILELDQKLVSALELRQIAQDEYNRFKKACIRLDQKKFEKKITLDKARFNVRKLEGDIDIMTKKMWRIKNQGG